MHPPHPNPCPSPRRKLPADVAERMPPMLLLHGTADKSVPMEIAVEFVMALKVCGCVGGYCICVWGGVMVGGCAGGWGWG